MQNNQGGVEDLGRVINGQNRGRLKPQQAPALHRSKMTCLEQRAAMTSILDGVAVALRIESLPLELFHEGRSVHLKQLCHSTGNAIGFS